MVFFFAGLKTVVVMINHVARPCIIQIMGHLIVSDP